MSSASRLVVETRCATYHTTRVIPESIATRVHQPVIWVTDALLVQPIERVPGFAHVAQHHVDTLVLMFMLLFLFTCRVLLVVSRLFDCYVAFSFQITPLRFLKYSLVNVSVGRCLGHAEHERTAQTAAIGVAEERFDLGLHIGREKIALNCRDAFRRLHRD